MVGSAVACDIKKRIICVTSYCLVLILSVEDKQVASTKTNSLFSLFIKHFPDIT